jgi:serine/threonine protein kinase
MALTSGDRLGPFEIVALVGEGGMGTVYRARDTRLGRSVALKLLHHRFSDRFEREARALAALNHPHICALYDVGPDYLVMEFVDGKPLQGPLRPETALRHAREIASALDAAHRAGVVHRDLKPANILIGKSGAKLLDFGLARDTAPLEPDDATRAMTGEGVIVGTLQYMAPEQIEGKEADVRSDIFSFGCVLYEILAGHPAFEASSKAALIAAILDRQPAPLTGVPQSLARAVERCLAKDPDERWQSARDLDGVLELAAGSNLTMASPKSAPRRKWTLGALALTLAALAGWGVARFTARPPRPTEWSGESLGGTANWLLPRASSDGQFLAFEAIVDGQAQVAVLKPGTSNYTVLTHQSLGEISQLAWSRDDSKIYFDREGGGPQIGVFSVPVLGGEPRLILEKAVGPQVLADGSLAVMRWNERRYSQLYRFWPESGKLRPLPAITERSQTTYNFRSTPDGRHLILFGSRADASGEPKEFGFFSLDPETGNMQQFARSLIFRKGENKIGLSGSHDGKTAILSVPFRGLYRLVAVPLDGNDQLRTLFTSTLPIMGVDEGPDGAIYADQLSSTVSVMQFSPSGGAPERLSDTYYQRIVPMAVLSDGRIVVQLAPKTLVLSHDGKMTPLLDSGEALRPPATAMGPGKLALMSDHVPPEIAVVSVDAGRVMSRVALKASSVHSLAASPDGQRFYYAADGFIWSIPSTGGPATKIAIGDSVAADPNGQDLVVALATQDVKHLVRVHLSGGAVEPIAIHGEAHLALSSITSGAVNRDGQIAVTAVSDSRWLYFIGAVDRQGILKPFPLTYGGETRFPMWTPDGHIVAPEIDYSFALWRFRPSKD